MKQDSSIIKLEKPISSLRLFPLLLMVLLFFAACGSFFLLKLNRDKRILTKLTTTNFNRLKNLSAKELFLFEKNSKREELRWRDGWSLSGDRYTFTDINSAKYIYVEKE